MNIVMSRKIRLVSFNILEGFRPLSLKPNECRLIDRKRAAAAKAVIRECNPDILVLNEALFCRNFETISINYAELFGYPFQASALYDNEWGNAILSRFEIIASEEMRIYNRGGLKTIINTPQGLLHIASYHPHPGRFPEHKARDFSRLVEGISGPLIVCGDLNCISPYDRLDRKKLIVAFERFTDTPTATLDQFLESGRLVFGRLSELGLEDAVPVSGRRYTIPTDLISTNKDSAIRIDHILANRDISVVGGEVVHNPLTNQASDHYPVMVDFHLNVAS